MSEFEDDFQENQSPRLVASESSEASVFLISQRSSQEASQYDHSSEQKQLIIEEKPEIIITEPDQQTPRERERTRKISNSMKKFEPIQEEDEGSHEHEHEHKQQLNLRGKKQLPRTRSKKSNTGQETRSIRQSQSEEFSQQKSERRTSTPKFSAREQRLQTPKYQGTFTRTNSSEKSDIRSDYRIDQQKYIEDISVAQNLFTDEEIQEAFRSFDLQKNDYITVNEVIFALECLGEYANDEEAQEMINMLDKDGSGRVYFEEFYKMATGQNLAPMGAVHHASPQQQPTESQRFKQQSAKISEVRVSERQQQSSTSSQPQIQATAKSGAHKHSIRKMQSTEGEVQSEEQSQERIVQQLETDVRAHQAAEEAILEEFIVTTQLQKEVLEKLLKKFYQLQVKDELTYEQFLIIAKLQDSNFAKSIFRYIDKDESNSLNLKEFIFGMARIIKGSKDDKIQFAFAIFDEDLDGQITKEELIKVFRSKFTHAEAIKKADQFCNKVNARSINLEHFQQLAEEFPLVLAPLHSVVDKLNALIF